MSNNEIKISKSTIALVALWGVIFPIYSFGYTNALRMRFFCAFICVVYIATRTKAIAIRRTWFIWLYALVTFISSLYNYGLWNMSAAMNVFVHPFCVLAIFLVPLTVVNMYSFERVTKVFLRCAYVYTLPTIITIVMAGRVDAGTYNPYFIGNKFIVVYFGLVMLCVWGLTKSNVVRNTLCFRFKTGIFCILGIAVSVYLYCTTGVICYLAALVLLVCKPFGKLLQNSFFVAGSVILSGVFPASIAAIVSIPKVSEFLGSMGELINMIARVRIYSILREIIERKFWFGYGNNSTVVMDALYSNAQNGLMHIMVQFGMIGVGALVLVCFMIMNGKNKLNVGIIQWCGYWLAGLIVAGIIEITFGPIFYMLLSFIYCATYSRNAR